MKNKNNQSSNTNCWDDNIQRIIERQATEKNSEAHLICGLKINLYKIYFQEALNPK